MKFKGILAVAAVVISAPSFAYTYSLADTYDSAVHGKIFLNFDDKTVSDATAAGFTSLPVDGPNIQSAATPGAVAPEATSGNFGMVSGYSLADYNIWTPELKSFGFMWGSIDPHNSFFFKEVDSLGLETWNEITGADLLGDNFSARYFHLNATEGKVIRQVRFTAYEHAFEFDDLSATLATGAVPEPATWGMMILGFGLVGFVARRQRQTAVSA